MCVYKKTQIFCQIFFQIIYYLSLTYRNDFAGRVFKVVHDKQRGPLSLVRVLSGKIRKGAKVTMEKETIMQTENVQRIYEPLADEYREITEIGCGDVAIFGGLKVASTKFNF